MMLHRSLAIGIPIQMTLERQPRGMQPSLVPPDQWEGAPRWIQWIQRERPSRDIGLPHVMAAEIPVGRRLLSLSAATPKSLTRKG
jgi:hypothetical protein